LRFGGRANAQVKTAGTDALAQCMEHKNPEQQILDRAAVVLGLYVVVAIADAQKNRATLDERRRVAQCDAFT
jgi:hypothetical protein